MSTINSFNFNFVAVVPLYEVTFILKHDYFKSKYNNILKFDLIAQTCHIKITYVFSQDFNYYYYNYNNR